ncbi:MAG: iron-containing alcohol dehydrogenase, partial [Planctomycetota bacterium]
DALAPQAGGGAVVVPVGSGVISDLGKWLAWEMDVPLVTFATAASMNGYASANVAPTIDGIKTLVRARPPVAVLADPRILADAPAEMTSSGLGDVLAKSVSSADWRMNHLLFGDYYCPRSVGLIADIEPLYLDNPRQLRDRRLDALTALFDALLLTGAAMTMAETSSPASGGEHLVSHSLDMISSIDGRPHDLHGRQVGVGTVLASEIYRRVLAVDEPDWREPTDRIDRDFWGPLADEIAAQYAEKQPRLQAAREQLADREAWDKLREELSPMLRTPEQIHTCLRQAGAACRAEDLRIDRHRLLAAFTHGHQIRSRFTILDLAQLIGVLPDAADEIVDQWG